MTPLQLVMPFAAAPSYHAADFIRGDANIHALEWITRWPDWPYSMLLLHGPEGSGKTHLAHLFAARSNASFIAPSRVGTATADQILTGNHSWILDGLEAVTDEAALAQLINLVRARGDYMLITARESAERRAYALPDLSSRIKALPAVGVGTPDDMLLAGVLAKSTSDLQLRIAPELMQYILAHVERSYKAIQRFVATIDLLSLTRGRAITQPLVREALKMMENENQNAL